MVSLLVLLTLGRNELDLRDSVFLLFAEDPLSASSDEDVFVFVGVISEEMWVFLSWVVQLSLDELTLFAQVLTVRIVPSG